jgi:DNA replication protein DnaC
MSECAFGRCDGSGFLYDQETNTAYDCSCRPQLIARAKARRLAGRIPSKYEGASFERSAQDLEPRATVEATRRFADRIDHHLDRGHGLWLMGPVGTGKTTLAMLVSRAALSAGRSVAIYSLPRLLDEIRDTYATAGSYIEFIDRLTSVDLLHVDDLGAERKTEWVTEELYTIVNTRYEDRRSMLLTTNLLDPEQLCAQIGERTVSRLTEMCDELTLHGHDRRADQSWDTPGSQDDRQGERAGPQIRLRFRG